MKKLLELINFISKKLNIINKEQIVDEEEVIGTPKEAEEGLIEIPKEAVVIQDNIVKNINFGLIKRLNNFDIVLVKMTDDEIKNNNIGRDHQIRPFLIDGIDEIDNNLCGYYLTSNVNGNKIFKSESHKGLKLVLCKGNYQLKNNSLVLYNRKVNLPYKNVIKHMGHLNTEDLKKLKKYIELIRKNSVVSSKDNNIIEDGDIVYFNGFKYIIYQVDNTNCYGYWIMKINYKVDLEKDHHYVKFNHHVYFIDYENNQVFNINDNLQIVDRFNEKVVEAIKENKKILKLEKRGKIKKRC